MIKESKSNLSLKSKSKSKYINRAPRLGEVLDLFHVSKEMEEKKLFLEKEKDYGLRMIENHAFPKYYSNEYKDKLFGLLKYKDSNYYLKRKYLMNTDYSVKEDGLCRLTLSKSFYRHLTEKGEINLNSKRINSYINFFMNNKTQNTENEKNTYQSKEKMNTNFNETLKELYYSLKTSNIINFTDYNNDILRTESDDNTNAMKTISTVKTNNENNYYQMPFTNIESGLEDELKVDRKRSLFKNMKSNEIMIEDNFKAIDLIEKRKFSMHSNVYGNSVNIKSPKSQKYDFIKRKGTESSIYISNVNANVNNNNNRKQSMSNFDRFMEEDGQNKKMKKTNKIITNKRDIAEIVPEFKTSNQKYRKLKKNGSFSKNSKDKLSITISESSQSLSFNDENKNVQISNSNKNKNGSNINDEFKIISEKIRENNLYLENIKNVESPSMKNKISKNTKKLLDFNLSNFTNKQYRISENEKNEKNDFIDHKNIKLNESKNSVKTKNNQFNNSSNIQYLNNNCNSNSNIKQLNHDNSSNKYQIIKDPNQSKSKSKYIIEAINKSENYFLPEIDRIKFYRKNVALFKQKKMKNFYNEILNDASKDVIKSLKTLSSFTKNEIKNDKYKNNTNNGMDNNNDKSNSTAILKTDENLKNVKIKNNKNEINKNKINNTAKVKEINSNINNQKGSVFKIQEKVPNIFIYNKELWTENKKDNVRFN